MNFQADFPFSEINFQFLRRVALKWVGLELNENKKEAVYNHLVRRLRTLHLSNFDEYCKLLKKDTNEISVFISLMTNISTAFFREKHHFKYLSEIVLPKFLKNQSGIYILSAGCATGEEPYSIAMVVEEFKKVHKSANVHIFAIDINSKALEIARLGIYPIESISNLGLDHQKLWFQRGTGKNIGLVKINETLQKAVTFSNVSLLEAPYIKSEFDVIFCRNVMIYFNKENKKSVQRKLDHILKINGYLMLGHSETLYTMQSRYEYIGKSMYKKINDG